MKKTFLLCLLLFLVLNTYSVRAAEKMKGKSAMMFNMTSLLLDIESSSDGVIMGAGLKYWLLDNLALRGLLNLNYQSDGTLDPPPDQVTTTSTLGMSVAGEYHFLTGDVLPYAGGILGIQVLANNAEGSPFSDYHFGALFGAEGKIKDFLSIYAEYSLMATIDADGFELDLASGTGASLGLLFYLK